MKPRLIKPVWLVVSLSAAAVVGAITATLAQDNSLAKPFNQYVINDVFPKAVNESFAETGRRWKEAAEQLSREAEARKKLVETSTTVKKTDLATAKASLKKAKAEKDLVQIGALEGVVRNEELTMEILKQLTRVTDRQVEVAESWKESGEAIEKFTEADIAFDPFRTRQLMRPEAGQTDQRLGADGNRAFRTQAAAMRELGESFRELGSRTETLAKERLDLLETLSKGGHIQAAGR
jgi:hypothetical protein